MFAVNIIHRSPFYQMLTVSAFLFPCPILPSGFPVLPSLPKFFQFWLRTNTSNTPIGPIHGPGKTEGHGPIPTKPYFNQTQYQYLKY